MPIVYRGITHSGWVDPPCHPTPTTSHSFQSTRSIPRLFGPTRLDFRMEDPQSLEYQILQQGDFPPPPDAEPSPYAAYEDHEYEPSNQTAAASSVKRGGRPKGSLTNSGSAKEKKDKMRVQNRAAAERSRAKKRDELYVFGFCFQVRLMRFIALRSS